MGDSSWQDPRLAVDLSFLRRGSATLTVGDYPVGSSIQYSLSLEYRARRATLRRTRLGWPTDRASVPQIVHDGAVYQLGLEVVDNECRAWVLDPVFWATSEEEDSRWVTLVPIGDRVAAAAVERRYLIDQAGQAAAGPLTAPVPTEARVWEEEGRLERRLGISLPHAQQVRVGSESSFLRLGEPDYPAGVQIGSGTGRSDSEFVFPISLDGSHDGRVFVLDAGNARIQVFDALGRQVTGWGRKGSAEGEFDFGSGREPEDFAGSIAVDNEGFIYVADVGNRRIQKFAP